MARLNIPRQPIFTHEGAKAKHINPEQQLKRSVMACLLWERTFYEEGEDIASRIASLVPHVAPRKVADMAIEAREKMKLRHVPLLLAREMARLSTKVDGIAHKDLVKDTLARVIQRPDELTEMLAIYWTERKFEPNPFLGPPIPGSAGYPFPIDTESPGKIKSIHKKQSISAQIKKGLAEAFKKFDRYQISKYDRPGQIRLRDVLFLCHAKPKDKDQEKLWKELVEGKLEPPDTWEVALSEGSDKKETWERLMKENRLGSMAVLRNLRNMQQADVDEQVVFQALEKMKVERILPFRFIAAARYAPQWETQIEQAMMRCLSSQEKLPSKTVLLVDVSGSMDSQMSKKSDMLRMDAGFGLAILLREVCEDVKIYSFSGYEKLIPARHGFALRDAIAASQPYDGTYLGRSVDAINDAESYDRLIVITDEQAHDTVHEPKAKGYMINVASYKNGVGYGSWIHIDGFSEAVIDYIRNFERG